MRLKKKTRSPVLVFIFVNETFSFQTDNTIPFYSSTVLAIDFSIQTLKLLTHWKTFHWQLEHGLHRL